MLGLGFGEREGQLLRGLRYVLRRLIGKEWVFGCNGGDGLRRPEARNWQVISPLGK